MSYIFGNCYLFSLHLLSLVSHFGTFINRMLHPILIFSFSCFHLCLFVPLSEIFHLIFQCIYWMFNFGSPIFPILFDCSFCIVCCYFTDAIYCSVSENIITSLGVLWSLHYFHFFFSRFLCFGTHLTLLKVSSNI